MFETLHSKALELAHGGLPRVERKWWLDLYLEYAQDLEPAQRDTLRSVLVHYWDESLDTLVYEISRTFPGETSTDAELLRQARQCHEHWRRLKKFRTEWRRAGIDLDRFEVDHELPF